MALLRAVNVGGRNKVPMAELRRRLEDDGYGGVRSYIASGNVLLTAPEADRAALARRLEATLADGFGVQATVVLRTFEELRGAAASHPFGSDTSQTFVTFLAEQPPAEAVRALAGLDTGDEELAVAGADVFVRYPNGYREARLTAAALEKRLGVRGTARNWRTVERLAAMTRE